MKDESNFEPNHDLARETPDNPRELLTEIKYCAENIGYIPLLSGVLKHGFSWGKETGNMSFAWENNKDVVIERITGFLKRLEMDPLEGTVNMTVEHGVNIVDITDETLEHAAISNLGATIKCDAFFTSMEDLPLIVKPADCTVSLVHAKSRHGTQILGMIHAGRLGLDLQLPVKAIRHLQEHYDVDLQTVLVGVVPTITKRRYYLKSFNELLSPEGWEGYFEKRNNVYYLDFTGYLLSQYVNTGLRANQIQAYDIDTYDAAIRGESFSHRYWREMNKEIPNGRMIVAAKL